MKVDERGECATMKKVALPHIGGQIGLHRAHHTVCQPVSNLCVLSCISKLMRLSQYAVSILGKSHQLNVFVMRYLPQRSRI